ncbi:unnamed protein product [Vicia faba]|uniref:Uncharacterized protein n=1 Tax=Vicia faba TaxID=3906 RepID=A0AAV1AXH9_VICFA|nr:unnamed protein product [Vicia faba]
MDSLQNKRFDKVIYTVFDYGVKKLKGIDSENGLSQDRKPFSHCVCDSENGFTKIPLITCGIQQEKVKELITCHNEIKVFKATESLKDKAMEQLRNEASKLDERFRVTEDHLKQKNLEIKKLRDEKKEALAAQYAAEATLRRVHANQKNEDYVPIDSSFIATGATANIVRDYQRQISELQDEKRTLDRELARVKVSANRIANVMTNEWKDESHKVMPLRQWKEEKRIMQAEMQRLKDKLAISERRAKAESQQKEKLKVRLKALEEGAGVTTVKINGLNNKTIDLSSNAWTYKIGVQGEHQRLHLVDGLNNTKWTSTSEAPKGQALTWYKATVDAPPGDEPVGF